MFNYKDLFRNSSTVFLDDTVPSVSPTGCKYFLSFTYMHIKATLTEFPSPLLLDTLTCVYSTSINSSLSPEPSTHKN